jgi:hypothetical protein
MLLANEGKPARERLTLIRILGELRELSDKGGDDEVRRYTKQCGESMVRQHQVCLGNRRKLPPDVCAITSVISDQPRHCFVQDRMLVDHGDPDRGSNRRLPRKAAPLAQMATIFPTPGEHRERVFLDF